MTTNWRAPVALGGLVSALFCASGAQASTQGSIGSTSTGTVSIDASVAGRVQISGLTDVAFSAVDPSTDASSAQDVCVWSNTAGRGYQITATGSGAGNAFTLASASLAPVPYSVEWSGSAGQSSGTALTAGTPLTSLTSTATRPGCSAGPTASASLVVKIGSADLQTMAAAASYTGTLTLLVAPE